MSESDIVGHFETRQGNTATVYQGGKRSVGWTIERRVWAIHWMVMVIWFTQVLGILAILLVVR